MKFPNPFHFSWFVAILFFGIQVSNVRCTNQQKAKNLPITIHGANALYPLAEVLATKYQELHPEVRITVFPASSKKGLVDVRLGLADIGMFSGLYNPDSTNHLKYLPIAMDAVVATINSSHPAMNEIQEQGMARDLLYRIFVTRQVYSWNSIPDIPVQSPLNVYTRSDASGAAAIWAEFLGCRQEDLQGIGVYGDAGMTYSIKADVFGIGYDNLGYVFNHETGQKYAGIEIVPIDLDSDGVIDHYERFYDELVQFIHAIKDGRYPYPLSRSLYFVISPANPNPQAIDFLEWAYTEGVRWIAASGYVELSAEEIDQQLQFIQQIKSTNH